VVAAKVAAASVDVLVDVVDEVTEGVEDVSETLCECNKYATFVLGLFCIGAGVAMFVHMAASNQDLTLIAVAFIVFGVAAWVTPFGRRLCSSRRAFTHTRGNLRKSQNLDARASFAASPGEQLAQKRAVENRAARAKRAAHKEARSNAKAAAAAGAGAGQKCGTTKRHTELAPPKAGVIKLDKSPLRAAMK
jgi:hypothetical protein